MARLLIVQQRPDDDDLVTRLPGLDDLDVEHATGTAAGLQRLTDKPFDALLLGAASTLEEDLEFLRRARALRPGIRAIFLADSATPEAVVEAIRAEVFAVFARPFHPDQIADLVRKAAAAEDWTEGGIRVLGAAPHWITLRVSAQLVTADRLVTFMDQLHRRLFPGPTMDHLLMAFREILLNAIEHGAGFDPEKDVRVDAIRTKRALTFYFRDPGPGFIPATLTHVASDADPISHIERREQAGLRPGGFGLMLSRQLVDEVVYNPTGNEVLLVKYLV
jgi:anti-sigma regulatory factor (Ser/Thr protein kinase)/CheY-like chemotaxis protein